MNREEFLNEAVKKQVKDLLAAMKSPVAILFFTSKLQHCDYCATTQQLLQEVTALSDKLELLVFDLEQDSAQAQQFRVDKVPGTVIARKEDGKIIDLGIRFSGVPAGHEFASLIRSLLMVSGEDSGLSAETRQYLASLQKPVHLQVFVTPT